MILSSTFHKSNVRICGLPQDALILDCRNTLSLELFAMSIAIYVLAAAVAAAVHNRNKTRLCNGWGTYVVHTTNNILS